MSQLTEVEFWTSLDAIYIFPDVDEAELLRLVSGFHHAGQVTLVNVSGACLVLPSRIVTKIFIGGIEKWTR